MLLAGPISHTSTQYIDFVEILSISLVCLLYILPNLVGVEVLFMYSCHTILECYNLFSGVKLSIRSFCFIS